MACRNACPDWKRNAVIAGNLAQQRRQKPTSLEENGSAILRELGLSFSTQVLISDKFVVDAVVDGTSLVIQWDGDYWHGYRNPGPRQTKRMNLDRSQDAYMRKCGYTVLRFWEHDVSQSKEMVKDSIRKTLESLSQIGHKLEPLVPV
jgi:very-short-patch-repair endonuclease